MLWAKDGALLMSLGMCFTWHSGLSLSLAPLGIVLQISLAKHISKAERFLMYLFTFLTWKVEVSLKATLLPPCPPGSPTLARGTGAQYCAELSSPAWPFVSPLFCVNQMPFVRSQTCCVHTHTNIPAQSVGKRGAHSDHAPHPPAPGHTRRGHSHHKLLEGLQLRFRVAGVKKVQVPIPQHVHVSLGAVCPAERSRRLLALLSLTVSFPPLLLFIHPLSWFFSALHPCSSQTGVI